MNESQDRTRQDQIRQDQDRGAVVPDRNDGRVPTQNLAQNSDEPPRPPRMDVPRMNDPRKDETTAVRPGDATRTSEAQHVTEPTRTPDATRTGDAARTPDVARTSEATRTGEATRTPDATRTGEATRIGEGSGPVTGARTAETRTTETHGARHGGPAGAHDGLEERLQHAMGSFVDEPRKSVEEADAVLEQAAKRLTEKLEERRRTLRSTWQNDDAKADTEDLRVALTHYRDLTQQLLSI